MWSVDIMDRRIGAEHRLLTAIAPSPPKKNVQRGEHILTILAPLVKESTPAVHWEAKLAAFSSRFYPRAIVAGASQKRGKGLDR
jgi:hypothetical protein